MSNVQFPLSSNLGNFPGNSQDPAVRPGSREGRHESWHRRKIFEPEALGDRVGTLEETRMIHRSSLIVALPALFVCSALFAQQSIKWSDYRSPDGGIDPTIFATKLREAHPDLVIDHVGRKSESVAVTSLLVLTFTSAGYDTVRPSPFREFLIGATTYLAAQQWENGLIGDPENPLKTFGHVWAMLAISQNSREGPSPERTRATARVRSAARWLLEQRDAADVWRVGKEPSDADFALTGLSLFALSIVESSEIVVDPAVKSKAAEFCRGYLTRETAVAAQKATGETSLFPGQSRRALTALALIAAEIAEPRREKVSLVEDAALDRLAVIDDGKAAESLGRDPTGLMLSAVCLHRCGGERWELFLRGLRPIVIDDQMKEGPLRGFWPPTDPFAPIGGIVYDSAMMTLSLEWYYRYPRVLALPTTQPTK